MRKISSIICAYNKEKTIKEGCPANFWGNENFKTRGGNFNSLTKIVRNQINKF